MEPDVGRMVPVPAHAGWVSIPCWRPLHTTAPPTFAFVPAVGRVLLTRSHLFTTFLYESVCIHCCRPHTRISLSLH